MISKEYLLPGAIDRDENSYLEDAVKKWGN